MRSLPTLPPRAAARLSEIERIATDMESLHQSATAQLRSLLAEANNPDASEEARALASEQSEAVRMTQQTRATARAAASQVAAQLHRFLAELPGSATLVPVSYPEIDQDVDALEIADTVATIRQQLSTLRSELRRILSAPLPLADLERQAREYVARLADQAQPAMLGVVPHFPAVETTHSQSAADLRVLRILAWLDPGKLADRLVAEIARTHPGDADAMSSAERETRRQQIEAEALELARAEEAYVVRAYMLGVEIERRSSADPRAILGIAVAARTAAKAA